MKIKQNLKIGDISENGQVTILDEDRLCYLVKSDSRGSIGLRTISKALLDEYVDYLSQHPETKADIIRNELCGKSQIDKYEYGYSSTLTTMANMLLEKKKSTTDLFDSRDSKFPLQQIFYGAPGTGKSHHIKEATRECSSEYIFRTTFHPDSDYSTFVGAYKPTMQELPRYSPQTGEWMGVEKKIVYSYTPQAFLKAYIKAWQNLNDDVYLIIEEINRGNCAQIFGDLFQLLDRNEEGMSDYPIKADQDIQNYLKEAFATNDELPDNIRLGEELQLPSNLYIWATMNTSDQSLFPIDSAFKRRWDWQYMPICKGRDEQGNELQWRISAGGQKFDWWDFVEKINAQIDSTTNSEDKKLGFFFCKAQKGVISAETFVGKVIFYLWNDVFKDYGFENTIFNDEDGGTLSFNKFYITNASGKVVVSEDKVVRFLTNLGVEGVEEYIEEIENDSTLDFTTYSFNGSERMGKSDLGYKIMDKFITEHPEYTLNQFKEIFPDTLITEGSNSPRLKGLIVSSDVELGSCSRYYTNTFFTSSDGIKFKFFKQWTKYNIGNIIDFALKQGWSVEEVGKWDRKNS